MTRAKEELLQHYLCPKCRGRKGDLREVVLAKSGLLDLLPSRGNRYIEVTCTLCGYTEFYNRALYLQSTAEEPQAAKAPIPEKTE